MSILRHEKLDVYQTGVDFVGWVQRLCLGIKKRVCAVDHLRRASEGVPMAIVEGNSKNSVKERQSRFEIAAGSALECAACLDVLRVRECICPAEVEAGKRQLVPIVSMLVRLHENAENLVREALGKYVVGREKSRQIWFSHEELDVYQVALDFVRWFENVSSIYDISLASKRELDKLSTCIVLNIAEGNGRFSKKDRRRFLGFARTATLKAGSRCDLLAAQQQLQAEETANAKGLLVRVEAMLSALDRRSREQQSE